MNFLKGFTTNFCQALFAESTIKPKRLVGKNETPAPLPTKEEIDKTLPASNKLTEKEIKAMKDRLTAEEKEMLTKYDDKEVAIKQEFAALQTELQQKVLSDSSLTFGEQRALEKKLAEVKQHLEQTNTYELNRAPLLTGDARAKELSHCQKLDSAKISGKTLSTIATENGMKMNELIRINQSLSSANQFAVEGLTKRGTPYCRATDTVYVYTPAYLKGGKGLADVGGSFETTSTQDQLKAEGLQREQAEMEERSEAREKSAKVMDTRQAIGGIGGSPNESGQKDRLNTSSVYLKKGMEQTLDSSLSPVYKHEGLFQTLNWEDFQKNWKDVVGSSTINALLNNSPTFQAAGFSHAQYMEAIRKGSNETLSFKGLIEQVYGAKKDVRALVQTLANRPISESVLKRLKGNFKNDYDRLLTDLTVEQKNPKYSEATGNVTLTLEKRRGENTKTATYKIPLNDIIGNKGLYEVKQEGGKYIVYYKDPNLTDKIAAPKLETSQVERLIAEQIQNIYMSPEGKFMSGDGTTLNIPVDDDFAKQFADERATLGALEQIYRDTAELFDATNQLRYADEKDRQYQAAATTTTETGRAVINEKEHEALKTNDTEVKAFDSMVTCLDEVFNTARSQKLTRRYRGVITLKSAAEDQITYQDVESHQFASKRGGYERHLLKSNRKASDKETQAEEVWQYFSGEGMVADIADQYVTVEKKSDGTKEVHFDEAGALKFLNTCLRLGMIKRDGTANLDTRFTPLEIKNFKLDKLGDEQKKLLRIGYLEFARAREVSEVQEGQEAREKQKEKKETQMNITFKPAEALAFIAETEAQLASKGDKLASQDREALYQHLIGGVGIGILRTKDTGRTETTKTYDAEGNLISKETETLRKPGTKDSIQLSNVGLEVNVASFQLPSGRSITIGVGGSVSTLQPLSAGSVSLGAGVAYKTDLGNLDITLSGGVGASLAGKVGAGGGVRFQYPLGPIYVTASAGVATGNVVSAGGGVGVNYEKFYENNLEKSYKKNGITSIEKLAAKPETTRQALAEAILKNPLFKNIEAQAAELKSRFPESSVTTDPAYYEYVISAYNAVKNDLGAQSLDRRGKPYVAVPCEIGLQFVHIIGTEVVIPVPYLFVTLWNTPLVYRSVSGKNYEGLSEARILEAFDKEMEAGPQPITDIPKMARDLDGTLAMVSGSQNVGGALTNGGQIAQLNKEMASAHLSLNTVEITPIHKTEGAEIEGTPVKIFELQADDVDGNMEIVKDPALGEKVTLSYQNGKDPKEGDKYYLAFNPGTPVYISRINYRYPFANEGAFEKTIIVISNNPNVTEQQLALYSKAPRLVKHVGKPTRVEAPANMLGKRANPIPTLDEYKQMPIAEKNDWSAAIKTDENVKKHMEQLGTINLGETIEAGTQEKLGKAAKELMDPKNSTDPQFRILIKRYTTASNSEFNLRNAALLCKEKATAILGKAPTAAENLFFIQAVTSYSYLDIKSQGPAAQQAAFDRMTERFTRPLLIQRFEDLKKRYPGKYDAANSTKVANFIIEKLQTGLDFTQKGKTLKEWGMGGAMFGSDAGTEGIVGTRIMESYNNDPFYTVLNLVKFDLDAPQGSEEYYAARAIVDTINPIPEKELSATDAEAVRIFLIDDFSQRVSVAWNHRNENEASTLLKLILIAKKQPGANEALKISLKQEPSQINLIKEFQAFVRKAREVEKAPRESGNQARRRIQIAGDYYLSFENVQVAYGIYERCGNNSSFLDERLGIEYKDQLIAVEDDSHRMVSTQNTIASHGLAITGFMTTEVKGGKENIIVKKNKKGAALGEDERNRAGSHQLGGGGGPTAPTPETSTGNGAPQGSPGGQFGSNLGSPHPPVN